METKQFTDEREAKIYRESKRDEGHVSSLFVYGKDRYRVETRECTTKEEQQTHQRWLSRKAGEVSRDIEDLARVKQLIEDPDFGYKEIGDVVFVAKKLNEERWFRTPNSVIEFFDYPSESNSMEKIKEMVDEAIKEYDDDWNEHEGVKGE